MVRPVLQPYHDGQTSVAAISWWQVHYDGQTSVAAISWWQVHYDGQTSVAAISWWQFQAVLSVQIMDLPSQLFYKNKLTCKSSFPPGGPNIPAVKFVSVEGHEEQDEDSPSFYNKHEADKVLEQVGVG